MLMYDFLMPFRSPVFKAQVMYCFMGMPLLANQLKKSRLVLNQLAPKGTCQTMGIRG